MSRLTWEGRLPVFGFGRPPVFVGWSPRLLTTSLVRVHCNKGIVRPVHMHFPDPANGSPRQNTGAEEMTPREARFHVAPSSGFMFSFLYAHGAMQPA